MKKLESVRQAKYATGDEMIPHEPRVITCVRSL